METQCNVKQYFSCLNRDLANFYFGKAGVFSFSPNKNKNQISFGEEKTVQDQVNNLQENI